MPYEDLSGTIVKKVCTACSREFTGPGVHCPLDGNMLMALPQDQWAGRKLLDRYQIKSRLGTGGMGVVYLAWHELMQRWVAIKMLKQSFVEDAQSVKRFQQEAMAASRLHHENVITLHDFGIAPGSGQPYMVMDYLTSTNPDEKLKARSLAQDIKELGQLPVERCIHIISQACDALDHAHRQGVIHRDVKPANIMIVPTEDDPDFVKVVDFGVAKLLPINNGVAEVQGLTQVGEVCGSPVYMSPEQCMGQSLDPRADIYSMGVVLYESVTGRLPLVGRNMVETMQKHMNEPPPAFKDVRPDLFIPERLEQVIMRAMSKHPHERQQTMSELAQDLQFSIPRPGQTPSLRAHELLLPPAEEPSNIPSWLVPVATGLGLLTVAAGVFFFAFGRHEPVQPPEPARTAVTSPVVTPPVTSGAATAAQPVQPNGQTAPTGAATSTAPSTISSAPPTKSTVPLHPVAPVNTTTGSSHHAAHAVPPGHSGKRPLPDDPFKKLLELKSHE